MNLPLILHVAAEYLIILPAIVLCFLPVTKWLKFAPAKLYPLCTIIVVLLCFALGCLNPNSLKYSANTLFLFLMLIFMIIYFQTVHLDKQKLFYLFLSSLTALSFCRLAGNITEAFIYREADIHKYFDYGLIAQFLFSFFFLGIAFLFRKKIAWIFENFHSKIVWRTIWTIPAFITFTNFMMVPVKYRNVWVGRAFLLYLTIEMVLLYFFMFFQFIFYQIAKTSYEKYMLEKSSFVYQIQARQYEALKKYMEQTRSMRHDFRHIMITVGELIQKGNYEQVQNYTRHYYHDILDETMPYSFCKNTAVNAILCYYANIATHADIQIDFQVGLPDKIYISDIDLSIVFGNLLENAIKMAKTVQQKKRCICLTADIDTPDSLYIVMTNSVKTAKQRESLSDNKEYIDNLSSVRNIAEKYCGVADFYENKDKFASNVMLKIKKYE